ncbi:MAG: MarR family transcriptional regulator [Lachnospiraceae bacterium]|nr:MarR family transcriptional regulator [Lachnospiraceae bacterium]
MDQNQLEEDILDAMQSIRASRHHKKQAGEAGSGRGKVLNYLYGHDGAASPGDLRDYMGVTTPRVTTVLNELENEGLIIREMADHDRRRICVKLTENGKASVDMPRKERREEIRLLIRRLGREDSEALLRICRVIETMESEKN